MDRTRVSSWLGRLGPSRALAVLAAIGVGEVAVAAGDMGNTWDPVSAYGGDIDFEIRRDGEPIGRHWVEFDALGKEIHATSRVELAVDLALFDYRFDYVSRDVWREGRLMSLSTIIDDDGDIAAVSAWRNGDGLVIDGPAGVFDVASDIVPTNHWNVEALASPLTLNTLTGEVIQSNYLELGDEMVETSTGSRRARKYLLTLDREIEVWYDLSGHWVGLRFEAVDGSTIDYFCLRCGSDQATESARR